MQQEGRAVEGWRFPWLDAGFCIAILAALVNFGYHGLQGDYGVLATLAIEAEARALEADLAALAAERAALENVVARLGAGYLDLDLLDEAARDGLGLMRADEITPR